MAVIREKRKLINHLSFDVDGEEINDLINQLEIKESSLMLDSGPTGSIVLDLEKKEIAHISSWIHRMLNAPSKFISQELIKKIIPREDYSFFKEIFSGFLKSVKKQSIIELKNWFITGELRTFMVNNKKENWFRYRILIITNTNSLIQKKVYLLCFFTDITLLKTNHTLSWNIYNHQQKKMIEQKTKSVLPLNFKGNNLNLTNRELEIVKLISEGLTNKQISEKLFVSNNTIKTHRSHIYEKLNVNKSSEMIKLCLYNGII